MNSSLLPEETLNFVKKTYDNLTYFDLYGNSVFLFVFFSLLVFTVFCFCKMLQQKEEIAKDWSAERCKPQNMLFAGFINKPDNVSSFQYTSDNFQYCVQNILTNVTEYSIQPFQYAIQSLTQIFAGMVSSIQQSREVTNKLRSNVSVFAEDILQRILNVTLPIQKMFVAVKDTFQKIQGSMTASFYTMLGSYYTLQAFMGAMLELIIKVLVTLVILIVGLWTMPFTWPAAASMTAVFLSISIPLSIIIYFMTDVLHVKTSSIPKLRCFDEKTLLVMKNGKRKYIKDVTINDELHDGSKVTGFFKVSAEDLTMYKLENIIVSSTHLVFYNNKWIRVKEHPDAVVLDIYDKSYVYCLNTNNQIIKINNNLFSDWDEFVRKDICGYNENAKVLLVNNIEKSIKELEIGDKLSNGSYIYGIVKLRKNKRHLLTNDGNLYLNEVTNVYDYNEMLDNL